MLYKMKTKPNNKYKMKTKPNNKQRKGQWGKGTKLSTNSKLRKMIKQWKEQKKEMNNWGEMMERTEPNTTAGEELFQIPTPLHCALQ